MSQPESKTMEESRVLKYFCLGNPPALERVSWFAGVLALLRIKAASTKPSTMDRCFGFFGCCKSLTEGSGLEYLDELGTGLFYPE